MGFMSHGQMCVFNDHPGHNVGMTPRGTRPDTGTHMQASASNAEKEVRKS